VGQRSALGQQAAPFQSCIACYIYATNLARKWLHLQYYDEAQCAGQGGGVGSSVGGIRVDGGMERRSGIWRRGEGGGDAGVHLSKEAAAVAGEVPCRIVPQIRGQQVGIRPPLALVGALAEAEAAHEALHGRHVCGSQLLEVAAGVLQGCRLACKVTKDR